MTHIAAALLAVAHGPYRQGFAYQHARSEACRSSLSAPPQPCLSGLSSVPGVTLSCSVARPAFCDLCVHRVLVCDLVCLRRVLKLQSFTTSRHDTKHRVAACGERVLRASLTSVRFLGWAKPGWERKTSWASAAHADARVRARDARGSLAISGQLPSLASPPLRCPTAAAGARKIGLRF